MILSDAQLKRLVSTLNLSPSQLDAIRPFLRVQSYDVGEHFVRAGEHTKTVGLIMQGVFRFYYITYAGDDVTKSFCAEGEFVGVYSSLILNETATFSIEALEPSIVLTFPFADFARLSETDLAWLNVRLRMVEQLYLKKQRREQELLLYDAQTRYLKFLEEYPQLEKRVKQYHIASYLGITPVSLSRIRSKLT